VIDLTAVGVARPPFLFPLFYYDIIGDKTPSNNGPSAFTTPGGVDSRGFKAPTTIDPATG
jgi:hypothetical protein